jgi:HlyD family secretion protein
MRYLKRFGLLLLAVVLIGGAIWIYRTRLAPASTASTPLTQTVAVRQGNLASNITVVGELDAEQLQSMTFSRMNGTAKLLKLNAATGASIKAGQALATIDPAPYQQALDQAKSDLQSAEENLANLQTPATKLDIAKADLAVAKAESSLEQANSNLADIQSPDWTTLEAAVRDAQDAVSSAKLQETLAEHDSSAKSERELLYAVDWHQRRIADLQALVTAGRANLEQTTLLSQEQKTLAEVQANLANIQAGRQLSLRAAAAATAKAQATLADAKDALATAQAGGDKLALAKARVAVQDAQVALDVAKDARAKLDQGTDSTALATAKANVDKKRLAVSEAQADLDGTTLVAPFDGTILRTVAAAGDLIAANSQILTIANLKTLQVLASVDETTIRRVTPGQSASMTFDALPGQTFRGKVLSVPLQGALQNNVMVYEVPVSLTGADNLPLLVGMTANVQIQTGQANNALLIPALALQQVNGVYQVLVPSEDPQGEPTAVTVEVGLSDGVNTQITRGLKAGDKVIVKYTASSSGTNQNNRNNSNIISQLFGRGLDFRMGGR